MKQSKMGKYTDEKERTSAKRQIASDFMVGYATAMTCIALNQKSVKRKFLLYVNVAKHSKICALLKISYEDQYLPTLKMSNCK